MSVRLAFLSVNPTDGSWYLKDKFLNDKLGMLDSRHPVVHLQWNPSSGVDLGIVDAAGRLCIFSHSHMAQNTTSIVRPAAEDQENDLNRPVGMFWLNRERPVGVSLEKSFDWRSDSFE